MWSPEQSTGKPAWALELETKWIIQSLNTVGGELLVLELRKEIYLLFYLLSGDLE